MAKSLLLVGSCTEQLMVMGFMYVYSCQIVHKKTASVLCLTTVKNEDKMEFSKILEAIKVCI